ncbi:XRE family transcriptional regulator [Actinoplanes hulinensis]|uniref:XRE family transcriptional regulator n=1 Tax=Actinoplanes hulinensis TaxID=1144547 RepID=A0ABS7AUE6_9ACTN|nr:XRE family transcriptional regulator [Actinoplanes hulinensis]MBW6432401.1 XRE family transcriptional regulator [Actinoplanes hulinensis]
MKHPLSRALRSAGLDAVDVAGRLSVDPKTVDRWISGRLPYPRHRTALVALTGWPERDLWPGIDAREHAAPDTGDILMTYAQRCSVPADTWRKLFAGAEREVGILAYSSLFLAEDAGVLGILRDKARAGVRVRIALGDMDGAQVAQRGADERIGEMMSTRIDNALILLRPLMDERGVSVRSHDTVLYNSIYRADDELMVNTHAYGCAASRSPVLHLRLATQGGMASTYLDSFERVWAAAQELRAHPTKRSKTAAGSAPG